MVVCRPSTLACTFYSLTSLAASHSPSFPFPLFYLFYVSPSSSFFSFSTLTFFLFILSLSHFPYFSFSSFRRFPLLSSAPLRPPSKTIFLFLSLRSLFLSLVLPLAYMLASRVPRLSVLFFLIFILHAGLAHARAAVLLRRIYKDRIGDLAMRVMPKRYR